jgi:hypothetical protein
MLDTINAKLQRAKSSAINGEAEVEDALKRERARQEAAVNNMHRLRALRAARTGNGNGLRESSLTETRRYLEQHFKALHKIPLAEVRRIDVANVLSEIKSPAAHNRARSTLSKFYSWAIGRG